MTSKQIIRKFYQLTHKIGKLNGELEQLRKEVEINCPHPDFHYYSSSWDDGYGSSSTIENRRCVLCGEKQYFYIDNWKKIVD